MIKDLLTSPVGDFSLSKTCQFIGVVISSGVIVWQAYQDTLTTEMFGIYLAVVVAGNSVNKLIAVREKTKEDGANQ